MICPFDLAGLEAKPPKALVFSNGADGTSRDLQGGIHVLSLLPTGDAELLDTSNTTSAAYWVRGIPSTFIGHDGQIIWELVGTLECPNPMIREALRKLL
jgi:hypothetical protein